MPNFVSSDNDSAESSGVLNDGDTVDLLQALVYDASSTDISESYNSVKKLSTTRSSKVINSEAYYTA
jgi:hypothetical protein